MDEYIKREAAIDAVTAVYIRTAGYKTRERVWETREAIQKLPAADVAPVVHCKDCTHRTEMGNCGHPRHHGILPTAYPYDFCSYGARMDGGLDNGKMG